MLSLIFWIMFTHAKDLVGATHIAPETISVIVLTTNTLIDLMGAVAIFTKLYLQPETEDRLAWFLALISGIFSLIAVTQYTFHDLIYPLYLVFSNLAIWLLTFRKRPRFRFSKLFHLIQKISGREWRN